jgi:23S rRNA pseudouridine1911/1915/1917 synthase
MANIISFIISNEFNGKSLHHFLKGRGFSTTLLRRLKNEGLIFHNHQRAWLHTSLNAGDLVEIHIPEEESKSIVPEPISFSILYEDDDLLVINKSSGIAVHPTLNYPSGTLANGVVHYFHEKGIQRRIRLVNRLDKDTSGIVIVALHAYAHYQLSEQMKRGEFNKRYIAFVHGRISEDEGEILAPIGRKSDSIIEREVREDGQHAHTYFKVFERFKEGTLVEVQLLTGRTHQIRVHFSYLGHPLMGDDLYGGERKRIKRQALHAQLVEFIHPVSKEPICITAPWPNDITQLYQELKDGMEE